MAEEDIRKIPLKKHSKDKKIWEGIRAIENRKNIVILPVDKGGGIVVLGKADYN